MKTFLFPLFALTTFLITASCSLLFFQPYGYEWEQVGDFSFGVSSFETLGMRSTSVATKAKDMAEAAEATDQSQPEFARPVLEGIACRIPTNRKAYGRVECMATVFEDLNDDQKVQLNEILANRKANFGLENSKVHFPSIRLKRHSLSVSVLFEIKTDLGTTQHVQQAR